MTIWKLISYSDPWCLSLLFSSFFFIFRLNATIEAEVVYILWLLQSKMWATSTKMIYYGPWLDKNMFVIRITHKSYKTFSSATVGIWIVRLTISRKQFFLLRQWSELTGIRRIYLSNWHVIQINFLKCGDYLDDSIWIFLLVLILDSDPYCQWGSENWTIRYLNDPK